MASGTERKAYRRPELIVYGNLREITKEAGPVGDKDNGKADMKNKTGIDD
jgi:hypothetical protein